MFPSRRVLSARVSAFLDLLKQGFPKGTPDELAAYTGAIRCGLAPCRSRFISKHSACVLAYRDGTFLPRAVVDAHLDRIAALDGIIATYVTVHAAATRAAAAADAAERRFCEGTPLGPLDGIPVAVKDLVAIVCTPCVSGSPSMRGCVTKRDAPVIGRLRAQGAVLLGKVHMVEFALGG